MLQVSLINSVAVTGGIEPDFTSFKNIQTFALA